MMKVQLSKQGISLIELLVVIAIIGILSALLLPAIGSVREKSRITQCQSNVRQIALAGLNMIEEHGDKLPRRVGGAGQFGRYAEQLLPLVNYEKDVFVCPSYEGAKMPVCFMPNNNMYTTYGITDYAWSPPSGSQRRRGLITDSSTMVYAYDFPFLSSDADRAHKGGASIAFLDGHTEFIKDDNEHYKLNSDATDEDYFLNTGHDFDQLGM